MSTSAIVTVKSIKKPLADLSNIYTLNYRQGANPHPMVKTFVHDGGLRSAIDRAKKFCENTNNRFIFVRPLISDLDAEEKQYLEVDER